VLSYQVQQNNPHPGTSVQSLPGTGVQSLPGTSVQSLLGTAVQFLPGTAEQSLPGTAIQSLRLILVMMYNSTCSTIFTKVTIRSLFSTALQPFLQ
jgi:hypothetical protein